MVGIRKFREDRKFEERAKGCSTATNAALGREETDVADIGFPLKPLYSSSLIKITEPRSSTTYLATSEVTALRLVEAEILSIRLPAHCVDANFRSVIN